MKNISRKSGALGTAFLAAALVFTVQATWSTQAAAFEVAPHRAVYELSLSATRDGNAPNQVRGVYTYTWERACDGWNVRQESEIVTAYPDGRVLDFQWSANSWESLNGTELQFFTRQSHGAAGSEAYRGMAEVAPGEGGLVSYQGPDARTLELPSDTLFPSSHSMQVLSEAEQGGGSFWRYVFDGTDPDDSLFEIFAVVSGWDEQPNSVFASDIFDGHKAAQVHLAFYKVGDDSGLPDQEQSFHIFDNGIVDELYLDFGRFTLYAKLTELELLDAPGC